MCFKKKEKASSETSEKSSYSSIVKSRYNARVARIKKESYCFHKAKLECEITRCSSSCFKEKNAIVYLAAKKFNETEYYCFLNGKMLFETATKEYLFDLDELWNEGDPALIMHFDSINVFHGSNNYYEIILEAEANNWKLKSEKFIGNDFDEAYIIIF